MKKSIRLTKDKQAFVVRIGEQTALFDVNLIKYHLEIPYTKKNGESVSLEEIKQKKQIAQENYIAAINKKQAQGA